jgi:hypothetical protein
MEPNGLLFVQLDKSESYDTLPHQLTGQAICYKWSLEVATIIEQQLSK